MAHGLARIAEDTPIPPAWTMILDKQEETERLARVLAEELRPGDLVTLSGGLGAGKTTLARALIRILARDPGLEVPSPTFTLLQGYDLPCGPVVHADFYRLGGGQELVELGWDEITEGAVALVEWPERQQNDAYRLARRAISSRMS